MTFDVYTTNSVTGERTGLLGSFAAESLTDARKVARGRWGSLPALKPGGPATPGPSMEVVAVDAPSFVDPAVAELAKVRAELEAAKAELAKGTAPTS